MIGDCSPRIPLMQFFLFARPVRRRRVVERLLQVGVAGLSPLQVAAVAPSVPPTSKSRLAAVAAPGLKHWDATPSELPCSL